jgi:DNA-binding MarR family transcriptional regulator
MTEPRWLSSEEQEAWRFMVALMFKVPAALDSQLQRDEDITHAGYMVLAMLSESKERRLRMSDLAAAAGTSQSRLSRIVARLEEGGYVTRRMSPEDRRAVIAELTEAGMAKIAAAAPGHVEEVRRLVFDRLSAEQVSQLAAICRSMNGWVMRPEKDG